MNSKVNLYKDILVYGIGAIIIKSVNLFLVPIYTRIFSPNEYGLLEILSIAGFFLSEIMVLGSDAAQSFYFSKYKKLGFFFQQKLITSILYFKIFWGMIVIILAMLFLLIVNIFFKLELFLYLLSFINIFIFQILIVGLQIFRNNYQPLKYVSISLLQVILTSFFTLIFVISFNLRVEGALYSLFFSNLISCLICWFLNKKYIHYFNINFQWWSKIIRFGLPLLPVGLVLYFITFSDRWLINYYFGSYYLGIYAVAIKIAFIVLLFTESFRLSWNPHAMDGMTQNNKKLFKDVARIYFGFGMILVVILNGMSSWILSILTTEIYHSANLFIGFLAISNVLFSFTQVVCIGILKKEKTIKLTYSYVASLLSLVCIQYLSIKIFGVVGIPIATAINYTILIFIIMFFSEKLWPVGFSIYRLLLQIFFGFGYVILFAFANISSSLLYTVTLTLITVLILLIVTVNKEDIIKLKFLFNNFKVKKINKIFQLNNER
jgi:O-antigen/teichoic acid export membrane protein